MKVEIISGGMATDLGDNVALRYLEQGGWGMAPLHRLTQQGPMQHGATDIGFRLDPRKLLVKLVALAVAKETTWTHRDTLLNIFRPSNEALTLRVTRDDDSVRQIDCFFSGGLGFDSSNRKGFQQFEVVELLAPDPTWYDPLVEQLTLALALGGDELTVPMPVPMPVGVSTLAFTGSVVYGGTWQTFPKIVITGPVTDLVITNLTLDTKLDFTDYEIDDETIMTIDLRYGYKTVVDQAGNNLIQYLTSDSDLTSFRLETDPLAPGGVNDIQIVGSSAEPASHIVMQWVERFIGI